MLASSSDALRWKRAARIVARPEKATSLQLYGGKAVSWRHARHRGAAVSISATQGQSAGSNGRRKETKPVSMP